MFPILFKFKLFEFFLFLLYIQYKIEKTFKVFYFLKKVIFFTFGTPKKE